MVDLWYPLRESHQTPSISWSHRTHPAQSLWELRCTKNRRVQNPLHLLFSLHRRQHHPPLKYRSLSHLHHPPSSIAPSVTSTILLQVSLPQSPPPSSFKYRSLSHLHHPPSSIAPSVTSTTINHYHSISFALSFPRSSIGR